MSDNEHEREEVTFGGNVSVNTFAHPSPPRQLLFHTRNVHSPNAAQVCFGQDSTGFFKI